MGNIFHDDLRNFIKALNNHEVEYILVGGYSVILHGYARTTGDIDIWVNPTLNNYQKLLKAFYEFGMAIFDMTEKNFLHNKAMEVFTFGRPPVSIDIMKTVKGLEFKSAFNLATFIETGDLPARVVDYRDLIKAKRASGRAKDLNDIENLRSKKEKE